MSTPRSQRFMIWIIAIVLTLGTLGSFLVMALSVQNQTLDRERLQKDFNEYQIAVNTQTKQLSDTYYKEFKKYASIPAKFDAKSITKLVKKDLKNGDGAEIKSDTSYNAYYIGWTPDGKIFDQSISGDELEAPIAGGNLITGWNEGVIGMKTGGVRELSIPSDLAYGKEGNGDTIPADTPLKFIIMIIPKVSDVPMTDNLRNYFQSQSMGS